MLILRLVLYPGLNACIRTYHTVVSGIFLLTLGGRGAGKGTKVKERLKWKREKLEIMREKVEKKKQL